MRDGGKGDRQRPLGIPEEQFASNWDQIFKKKQKDDKEKEWSSTIDQKKSDKPS